MQVTLSGQGIALDIDDTLSGTNAYFRKHLNELFPRPDETPEEKELPHSLERSAYWRTHPGAQEWVRAARNSHELQEELPLLENANHMVERLQAIVPVVAYITARPDVVLSSTKNWLARNGFPDLPIIARPKEVTHEEGPGWKAALLHELYPQVLGIVDDNENLVDNLPADYKGVVFLYTHSEHPRGDIRVVPCKDWEEVIKKVRETKL